MSRSQWAAHGGLPEYHIGGAHFTDDLKRVEGAYFEQSGVTPKEWQTLAESLVGRLVLPQAPDYNDDRASNPRFDERPNAIVYCANANDIVHVLALARDHRDMRITCRSGGHSTAGFSVNDGMVIDLSLLSDVRVDKKAMQATVAAGTSFQILDSVLNTYGLHVPSGGCPDVCVGGYMQGGGYGFTTRQFGINCDRVQSFEMVLPDGRIVHASEKAEAPLFWAVRGGTGNQFGVLTNVTYELTRLKYVAAVVAMWSLDDGSAPVVLDLLQQGYMQGGDHPQLGYQVMITNPDPTTYAGPVMIFMGMQEGTADEILKAIEPLTRTVKPIYIKTELGTYDALNADLVDHVLPGPGTPGTLELKRSGFIAKRLGVKGWAEICRYMSTVTPNPYNMAYLEAYGGAVDKLKPLDNAFIHRNVDADFVIDSFWNPAWKGRYPGSETQDQAQAWMDGLWKLAGPHTNGHVYQDYPDRTLKDYRWNYWGDAYPSLQWVKSQYDPSNLFQYGQPITPYPSDKNLTRSTAPSLFGGSSAQAAHAK